MPQVVVLDACVLYPAPLRSFFMYMTTIDLFRAKWTDAIHDEWMRNVLRDRPDMTRSQVEKIRDLMNSHARDCLVRDFEGLITDLTLPDPDDRHVLAAAIKAGAEAVVTFNLKDFPTETLRGFGVVARHPDDFVVDLFDRAPEVVLKAAGMQRASLKRPPLSVDDYLAALARQNLPRSVARLRERADSI
ncbi:MAG: PIN domain-containing protein [Paludisphaera borealis]|uniref:PIN domain-containing protein n=1 Tax=Paludisphaera borealis TaxID=1387353 RepID=UPI0028407BAB|nr:PIN domain-containing protein [Paludisphaera borealis]MDR3622414.1 PIN domain-containing protein [Paludisphaera borealis]